jgi:predicted secreted protein
MNTTGTKSCKISGSGGVEVDAGYATLVSAMNDGTAVPLVYTGSAFVVTGDFVLESIKSSGKNDDNETYEYSFVNEGEFTVEAA